MIERVTNLVRCEILHQIEMRHLSERMHARIGAPRAGDGDAFAGEPENCLLQRALHRCAIVLPLPPDEWPAVIFDGEAIAWHIYIFVMAGLDPAIHLRAAASM